MNHSEVINLIEQALDDSILEFECPNCGTGITSEPDATGLYCVECKMIVMQNPLIESGLI